MRIRAGTYQTGTVAEPLNMQGWQVVDELNRLMAGQPVSGFVAPVHLVVGSQRRLRWRLPVRLRPGERLSGHLPADLEATLTGATLLRHANPLFAAPGRPAEPTHAALAARAVRGGAVRHGHAHRRRRRDGLPGPVRHRQCGAPVLGGTARARAEHPGPAAADPADRTAGRTHGRGRFPGRRPPDLRADPERTRCARSTDRTARGRRGRVGARPAPVQPAVPELGPCPCAASRCRGTTRARGCVARQPR